MSKMTTADITGSGLSANQTTWKNLFENINLPANQTFSDLTTTTAARSNVSEEHFNCDAWSDPSRIVLQIFLLFQLFINFAAAGIVFNVPTNIRGKHVAFLFGCVRILNLLDLLQCAVLFFGPLLIPTDCNPAAALCDFVGYLFATCTLLSPVCAVVMAVDRAVAVYFHVWYKAHPYLKVKYTTMFAIIGSYCFYLLLPIFTSFGKYVAVPWLAVCGFEWGVEYRAFNLVLAAVTVLFILTLLAANIAIVIRIRQRKKQMKKLKRSQEKSFSTSSIKRSLMKKPHRSADDILSASLDRTTPPKEKTSPSVFRKRMSKSRPPPLTIPNQENDNQNEATSMLPGNAFHNSDLRVCPALTPNVTPPLTPIQRSKTSSVSGRRPQVASPLTAGSNLLTPPFDTSNVMPPSPLVKSRENLDWNIPRTKLRNNNAVRPRSMHRCSSVDSILQASAHSPMLTPGKPQTPTLLRQVLDYPAGKLGDAEIHRLSTGTRSSDEGETSKKRLFHSSTSSVFQFSFGTIRGFSSRSSERRTSRRRTRKSASRITKMTTTICLVFIILYLPFMVRKLVQLIPPVYGSIYVPEAVEIATLFGPLLSPLCNPIVYVFLNPHYRENFWKKLRKFMATCQCWDKTKKHLNSIPNATGSIRRKRKPKNSSNEVSSPNLKPEKGLSSDVFEPDQLEMSGKVESKSGTSKSKTHRAHSEDVL